MGHPSIVQVPRRGGRPLAHTFRQPQPPPPVLVPQEFVGPCPSGTTIVRLSRATNAERTLLARRVIDQFLRYRPANGRLDEQLTLETATAFFLAIVAVRAGMRQRSRNSGDENVLRDMRNILVSCVTRENARDVAAMVHTANTDHLGATMDDRRATARPVMQRILAHGFIAVSPEIRTMAQAILVTALAEHTDSLGVWTTVTNMTTPLGTQVPPRALVLVPRPLARPIGWEPPNRGREVTYVAGGAPVFIDPSFVR